MQISFFLKNFEKIIHDKDISKKMICEVLYQNLKKDFKTKDIKVVKSVLYINTDIFIKNTIFLKKEKILKDFENIKILIKEIK